MEIRSHPPVAARLWLKAAKEVSLIRLPRAGRCLAVGLLVLASGSGPASARGSADRMLERIAEVAAELHQESWGKAERMTRRLVLDIQRIEEDPTTVSTLLGRTEVWRAVALAGQRELDEAAWRWHVAAALLPHLELDELGEFGEVGQRLVEVVSWESREVERGSQITGPADRSFVTPGVSRRRPVVLPSAHRPRPASRIMIRVLVDVEGRPRAPEVLFSRSGPVATHGALDSLRRWSFKPALLAGLPVPFLTLVSVEIPRR